MASKCQPWASYFRRLGGDEVTLTLAELEDVLGDELPASALEHLPWWSGTRPHTVWLGLGWKATPRLAEGRVLFKRVKPLEPEAARPDASAAVVPPSAPGPTRDVSVSSAPAAIG
ncbi:MAG: hypothetical protein HOI95_25715, partial [Chromatiales bacterium]|nr:hypothetical protein [Chromatiales bacterium]